MQNSDKWVTLCYLVAAFVKHTYDREESLDEIASKVEAHFILYGIPGLAEEDQESPEIAFPGISGFLDSDGNIQKIR